MPAFDSLTSRSPNGFTNAAPWQTMGASGVPDPSWAHQYHNDFDTYNAGDFTATVVGTGTEALAAADGGALLLTNSAGIADAIYMQLVQASFKLIPGKATFFKFAGTLSDVVNDVFYAGLIAKSATPLTANDGLFIQKPTGAATLQLVSKVGGVATTVNLPAAEAPVANVPFEVGISVDVQGNVAAYFNPTTGSNPISAAAGVARGRVASLLVPGVTQALLSPSFGLLNSTAAARSLQADYITAIRER